MNRHIPDEIIDEVRRRCNIVDVINSYVPLKRSGATWQACCPFHQEKTPSFKVNEQRQIYHCFGCGKGGNVFSFVMERENVDFPNAVHMLAARCSVIIPEKSGPGGGEGARQRADERERLYSLHERLAELFRRNLKNNPDSPVAAYFKTRDIPDNIAERFGIGAAQDSWDAALRWGRSNGFTEDEMLKAGVAIVNEEKNRVYDRFRNRLVFPIWNEQGRVVAFSARTIEKQAEGAKYVNSPETPIFRKSSVLYALPLARKMMAEKKFAVLCEGQLDVIAMHRAGYENAVAPQGTAFTDEQAVILKRYADELRVAFDSDSAGVKAALRAVETALPKGLDVKIIRFPNGKDPDEIFKNEGPEKIAEAVENPTDFFEFVLGEVSKNYDASTPTGKGNIVSVMSKYLLMIENLAARAAYVSALASRLGLPESAIFGEVKKARINTDRTARYQQPSAPADRPAKATGPASGAKGGENFRMAEEILLELALAHGPAARQIGEELPPEMLSGTSVGKALEEVISLTINGEWEFAGEHLKKQLDHTPDPEISRILVATEMAEPDSDQDEAEKDKAREAMTQKKIRDCLAVIKKHHLQEEIADMTRKIPSAPDEEKTSLMAAISGKRKELIGLSKTQPR